MPSSSTPNLTHSLPYLKSLFLQPNRQGGGGGVQGSARPGPGRPCRRRRLRRLPPPPCLGLRRRLRPLPAPPPKPPPWPGTSPWPPFLSLRRLGAAAHDPRRSRKVSSSSSGAARGQRRRRRLGPSTGLAPPRPFFPLALARPNSAKLRSSLQIRPQAAAEAAQHPVPSRRGRRPVPPSSTSRLTSRGFAGVDDDRGVLMVMDRVGAGAAADLLLPWHLVVVAASSSLLAAATWRWRGWNVC